MNGIAIHAQGFTKDYRAGFARRRTGVLHDVSIQVQTGAPSFLSLEDQLREASAQTLPHVYSLSVETSLVSGSWRPLS